MEARPTEKTAVSIARDVPTAMLRSLLALSLTVAGLAWALDLQRSIGLLPFPGQLLAAILALVLPLVFLSLPAPRGDARHARLVTLHVLRETQSASAVARALRDTS